MSDKEEKEQRGDQVEILLVEDNPNDAEIAIRALKRHHLANRIVHVMDGREALDFVFGVDGGEGSIPRVILLDLKLPRVSGLEVLKAIKEHPDTRTIPVVVLTSSNEESDLVASYNLGANSYLVKPVDFEKFSDAIKDFGLYWLLLNRQPGSC
jgi:two-component system, response regulator